MNNHHDEFDQKFDEAFDEIARDLAETFTPDHRPSWEKMKIRLKVERRKKRLKKTVRHVSGLVSAMILGAMILGNFNVTKAFNPFYQNLKQFPGEVVSFFFGNKDESEEVPKTPPPLTGNAASNVYSVQTSIQTVSLDEAGNQLAFSIPTFGYVPTDYELNKTEIFMKQEMGIATKVRLTFQGSSDKTFWVTLQQLDHSSTIGSRANKSRIEVIQTKYGKAFFVVSQDGSSKLEFLNGNIYVNILGELKKKELIDFIDALEF